MADLTRIEQLKAEAAVAGDLEMVLICEAALAGDYESQLTVADELQAVICESCEAAKCPMARVDGGVCVAMAKHLNWAEGLRRELH